MFSMCSELTPRAHIPDTRIPQLMQPCCHILLTESPCITASVTAVMIMIIRILNLKENAETERQRDEDKKPRDSKEDPPADADPSHEISV